MTQIIPLSEGSFTIDQTKEFIPFKLDQDDLQSRSRGSLLVEIQPFLVITEKDIILLDTGLGFTDEFNNLQIHQHLIVHDINPLQVTKVLMSHLHKDHAGGVTKYDLMSQQYFLSFPNAKYYINEQELNFALQPGNPSYHPSRLALLQNHEQVVLLGNEGIIDDYIYFQVTAAHSPHHQVFTIDTGDGKIFFGGDDAPQLKQMKNKFVAKYNHDGKKAASLRNEWWEAGNKANWTFLFYHDIQTPSIRL